MNRSDFKSGLFDLDLAISAQGLAADQDELSPPVGEEEKPKVQVASLPSATGKWATKIFGPERSKLYTGHTAKDMAKNKPKNPADQHATTMDAMDALRQYQGDKTKVTPQQGTGLPPIETSEQLGQLIEQMGSAKFPDQRTWQEVQGRTDTVAKVMEELRPIAEGRQGGILSDVQLHGVSRIVSTAFKDIERLSAKFADGTETPEDILKMAHAKNTYEVMHSYLEGQGSEVGRALNSLKMTGEVLGDQNFAAYEKITGTEQGANWANGVRMWVDAIQKRVDNGESVGKATQTLWAVVKGDKTKMLVEFWKNNQLSGIKTHVVNNASVAAHVMYERAAVRPVASVIGHVRHALAGGEQPIRADEVLSPFYSSYAGLRGWMELGWENLATGKTHFNATDKVEDSGALKSFIDDLPMSDTKKKVADYATSASFKLLTASDEANRAVGFTQEMYGLASRQASGEGLSGEAHVARMNALLDDPPVEMYSQAMTHAKQMTFTDVEDKGWIAVTAKAMRGFVGKVPPLQFIIPYINTPSNLLRVGMEMSPLAPISKRLRDDIAAGGVRADIATAKMTMGMGMGIMYWQLYESGVLTGSGPEDYRAQEMLKADGWQPWSLQIEGQTWMMERMDPFTKSAKFTESLAFFLGEMDKAKYAATDKDKEDSFARGILYLVDGVMEDQWMDQASGLMKALEGKESWDKYLARTGAGFVPYHAALKSWNEFGQEGRPQLTSDSIRSSFSDMVEDQIQGNMPGSSHFVRVKRNWDGDMHKPEQTDFAAGASPFGPIELKSDQLTKELFEHGVIPQEPSPIIEVGGKQFSIKQLDDTGKAYDAYLKSVGKARRHQVREVVANSAYQKAKAKHPKGPNSYAARELTGAIARGKDVGKKLFLAEFLGWLSEDENSSIRTNLNRRFATDMAVMLKEAIETPELSELEGPVVGQPPRQRFEYPIPEMK